ncbi:MFS transporter [Legionella impletisoli]|uniref:MFS transporter n=1 Tax=Legionella impletisoli TaxID=343510 RepID=A0A917JTX4_9GAMM|nr:MFS transporter [Legionella impletisoli]GGI85000.1 MFS transporter [Legionella impletisoli]
MLQVIAETFAPLLSLFLFILGAGFFSTLLALVMTLNGASPIMIGALTGVFYAGLVSGSFRIERFITRVGHIRAFSAFSSTLAITCLLHGLFYNPWFWMVLRFIAGFASAGLFVVIESWLLCKSTTVNRGQVLALYMITFYAGQSLGQFFLNLGDPQTMLLFSITSMLCSLSIIPLSMTHVRSPQYDEPSTLSFKKLISISASGVLGCFISGLIMGSTYGLMPSFLSQAFHSNAAVAKYMFAIIIGGMLLQYPVGKLSDIFERRLVLIVISSAAILTSLAILLINHQIGWLFFLLMVCFGGLTFTLYPISITQACEALDTTDLVAGTQSLLLMYSIGAMVGPLIAPAFIEFFGERGLFVYFITVCAMAIPILILRKAQKPALPQEENFVSMPQTSPILFELDPRGEENGEVN